MRGLLDVNVLIALLDIDHVHHSRVHSWWKAYGEDGWASCPITENGAVRILSGPSYPGKPLTTAEALQGLAAFIGQTDHIFWPDSISLLGGSVDASHLTSRRITDSYLLALAFQQGGKFVTLDETISARSVRGLPTETLVVIP
jgi:uncharacterized protein